MKAIKDVNNSYLNENAYDEDSDDNEDIQKLYKSIDEIKQKLKQTKKKSNVIRQDSALTVKKKRIRTKGEDKFINNKSDVIHLKKHIEKLKYQHPIESDFTQIFKGKEKELENKDIKIEQKKMNQTDIPKMNAVDEKKAKAAEKKSKAAEKKAKAAEKKNKRTPEQQKKINDRMAAIRAKRKKK